MARDRHSDRDSFESLHQLLCFRKSDAPKIVWLQLIKEQSVKSRSHAQAVGNDFVPLFLSKHGSFQTIFLLTEPETELYLPKKVMFLHDCTVSDSLSRIRKNTG